MRRFRCFFVDERDCVESFEPIDLEDEAEAVRRAENMLRWRSTATAAELWGRAGSLPEFSLRAIELKRRLHSQTLTGRGALRKPLQHGSPFRKGGLPLRISGEARAGQAAWITHPLLGDRPS